MGHPVLKHRYAPVRASQAAPTPVSSPAPSAPAVRRVVAEPRLLPLILPIVVLGGLAMLHVVSLARLSELEGESRRLERLTLEQTMRRGELMRARAQLTNTSKLLDYAVKHGMVTPTHLQPIKVGLLPAAKVYWALPGERRPGGPASAFPATGQIGQLLPLGSSGGRRL